MSTFHPTPEGLEQHPESEAGNIIVYLVHFERNYEAMMPDGRMRHIRHYIGMTNDWNRRRAQHMNPLRSAKGARLLAAVNAAGIAWKVVGWWDTGTSEQGPGHKVELAMKAGRNHARKCPICTPATAKPRKPRMAVPDWKKNKPKANAQSATIHIQSEDTDGKVREMADTEGGSYAVPTETKAPTPNVAPDRTADLQGPAIGKGLEDDHDRPDQDPQPDGGLLLF